MINFIEVENIKELAKLASEIWHEYWVVLLSPEQINYMVDKFQSEHAIKKQIENENYIYFYIILNDEKAGYFGLSHKKDGLFLSKLYVKKEFRRNGLGSKAFEFIKNYAKSRNFGRIYLTVNKQNENTIKAYKKWGFDTIDAVVTDIGSGFVMDDYIMEYNLKPDKSELVNNAEKKVKQYFERVDEIKEYNQEKVLKAFVKNKIGLEHFATVSGYGHDDMGREALDNVYADVFKAEKAIVRNHFVSGTHTLCCCLFGNLRHGEKLVSVAGTPYDTMEEVIGTRGDKRSSLIGHGVLYDEIPLLNGIDVDFEGIKNKIDKSVNMVLIQRSRGYSLRKSLNIETIAKIVETVKSKNPDCICFVDNCYGEFTEKLEPLEVGADLIAGSLIKNPGGGIVEAGGYIAGKEEYVNQAAYRLTAPGIGSEGGAMLNQLRLIFQGLFMAPSVVSEAVKGAILAAQVFEDMGFISFPRPDEKRTDIIQTINFGAKEPQLEFCKTLQMFSPVESYLTPVPDGVPGYDDKLIMAGGTFIEGSTIELSADGPVRPPYAVYMQGGLNYAHVKLALKGIVENLLK